MCISITYEIIRGTLNDIWYLRYIAVEYDGILNTNTKGRNVRLCSDYELTKDGPYLVLTGELWGDFSEFFGENISQDALYSCWIVPVGGVVVSNSLQWRHNGAIASQFTSLMIVYSTVYSGADQRKHQRSASLAFVRGIHRGPVNSPHKWPVTRKMFPFDDVIMYRASATTNCITSQELYTRFALYCELVMFNFTHIRQGYFPDTGAILRPYNKPKRKKTWADITT